MKQTQQTRWVLWAAWALVLAALAGSSMPLLAEVPAEASRHFQWYSARVEERLEAERHSMHMNLPAQSDSRLRLGEVVIENLTPPGEAERNGAMLHHWRATAFAQGAHAVDLERVLENFSGYAQIYAPQVLRAQLLNRQGDTAQVKMRVKQKHVLVVVLDTTYNVQQGRVTPGRGFSLSRSIDVREIANAGSNSEMELNSLQEHGFLWRQNTYWSWEERDGGLYVQVESLTLTRSITTGLGWAIRPFVESVPKESLEFTLKSTCQAARALHGGVAFSGQRFGFPG